MRVCIIAPGQPSTTPRLVKEADALHEAGHDVNVLCAHWANWAVETDDKLLASRKWQCTYVGGSPRQQVALYYGTRLRQAICRRILPIGPQLVPLQERAACRVLPELIAAAKCIRAHLYIAHTPSALPAAAEAARMHRAKFGFDAEDLHAAMEPEPDSVREKTLAVRLENRFLPDCTYFTAASPGTAEAYLARYPLLHPVTILNVFPTKLRPRTFRSNTRESPITLYWFSQTIGPGEGLEDAIRAMAMLQHHNIAIHLRGTCSPGYREALSGLAQSLGIPSGRIIWHEPAPPDDMVRLSAEFDIGLSLQEPISKNHDICLTNKIFTYILAGNAIAATATSGQNPVIENIGPGGFSYQHGDVKTLAARIDCWCQDRAALEAARQESWQWGTRLYNWDVEKKKLISLAESVATAGPVPTR